ncbi:hypothetical protein GX586_15735 [bacterium]|nr:hypothetical protein [bacterium]
MKGIRFAVLSLACAAVPLAGVTRYVAPNGAHVSPYTSWATAARSIQPAINLSAGGDEVVVSNGVYISSVYIYTYSNITVRSLNGPQVTVIDGSNNHLCVFLSNASNAVFEGFTLRNGRGGAYAGGAYLLRGGLLRNCIVRQCFATNGAGVFIDLGGGLESCTIEQNTGWYGGGVHLWYAPSALVSNCVIRNNVALEGGGGVFCRYGGTVAHCTITNNVALYGLAFFGTGGGVLTYYGGTVSNCVLSGNYAHSGGGVYCMYGGLVQHCMIRANHADSGWTSSSDGGGVGLNLGTVIGCAITGNYAHGHAGGVLSYGLGDVRDSIICGNTASNWGGGAYISYGGSFSNCVIGANRAASGGGAATVVQTGRTGMFLNCVITGNLAHALAASGGGLYLYGLNMVSDSLIAFNTASGTNSAEGGGISDYAYTTASRYISVLRCTINGNVATGHYAYGGGVQLRYGAIDRCVVSSNLAAGVTAYGGGLACGSPGAEAISSLIVCNAARGTAVANGGGVYNANTGLVVNCTICDNSAAGSASGANGGGVFTTLGVPRNCIVYFNSSPSNANVRAMNGCLNTCATPLQGGVGNLADDPDLASRAAGNYRLLASSPCIDKGTNMPWMAAAKDLDGNPRLYDGRVDMGAYEYVPEPCALAMACSTVVLVLRLRAVVLQTVPPGGPFRTTLTSQQGGVR